MRIRIQNRLTRRRGFVLITTMWIAIALAAIVLVLCREMQVELMIANQHLDQAKADAAEIGVEQYAMSVIEQDVLTPGYKDTINFEQRELGDCYFWILSTNVDDETLYAFGITDESSKLDINLATDAMLEYLPNIDPVVAAAMVDWRDPDDTVTVSEEFGVQGAEADYYLSNFGYRAKNANFESVDEVNLLTGIIDMRPDSEAEMWGLDRNHNGVIEANETVSANTGMSFSSTQRGFMPFITVYGYQATNPTDANLQYAIDNPPAALTDITALNPLDINNTNTRQLLTQLVQQYLPNKANGITTSLNQHFPQQGRGGTTTTTPYTNLFQLFIEAQLTSEDLTTTTDDGTPLFNLLTCRQPTTTTTTPTTNANGTTTTPQTKFAKINLNTASKEVLMCIPGWDENDAYSVIQYREQTLLGQQDYTQVANISWVMDVVAPEKLAIAMGQANSNDPATQGGTFITGSSTVFSADIVTVTKDGRAFRRVKVVIDDSSGTPQIIYRRDLTDSGWPLDPNIRTALRNGQVLPASGALVTPNLTLDQEQQ